YIRRSGQTILRITVLYNPLRFFTLVAFVLAIPGVAAFLRFLYFYAIGDGGGNIQSLVIGAAFIAAATVFFVGGLIADLVAANRVLSAEIRARLLRAELERAK
ncbi:MAG: glycosyltransferase family 2 protein, partial [Pseudomonadota bacterium]